MRGGLGNDNYYVDDAADVTDETTGGGGIGDYVLSTASFTAAAGIERIYLLGAADINATGRDAQEDFLLGNSGNNVLDGKSGIDTMRGGLGNDNYYVDNIADVTDEVTGGGGIGDYVLTTVSFEAAAGIERIYLLGRPTSTPLAATGRLTSSSAIPAATALTARAASTRCAAGWATTSIMSMILAM